FECDASSNAPGRFCWSLFTWHVDFGSNAGRPCIVGWLPSLVRVVQFHVLNNVQRIGAQVLLVHDSIVAHDEALCARHAVFRWNGSERKPANHNSLDDVVNLANRRRRPLPLQDLEVVAVKARLASGVAFLQRLSHCLSDSGPPVNQAGREVWWPLPGSRTRPTAALGSPLVPCSQALA